MTGMDTKICADCGEPLGSDSTFCMECDGDLCVPCAEEEERLVTLCSTCRLEAKEARRAKAEG
jgi:hypothetical protein